jgi:hypothetical protein
MATAAANLNDPDERQENEGADAGEVELQEVFERAQRRFDMTVGPQLEMRSLALAARRFVTIPGAMWEGDFGDAFDNSIKLEINLARDGLEKIYRDYTENRIVPDFRPASGKGDDDSADTLDGMYRADAYFFKAAQAWDNAFFEGAAGGMGAYRLATDWADPYDKESDAQRINPGLAIVDADQRVFFDGNSMLYDKSDAEFAFVITAKQRDEFEAEYDGAVSDWTLPRIDPVYDWFTPDTVKVAEYYEVEDHDEKLLILTQKLSGKEERYWESEIDPEELDSLKKMGWSVKTRSLKRRRVHKYLVSGEEVLEDKGLIAGDRIPVAPYYGKRSFVDGVERFEGYVQGKMDVSRAYNMVLSKLAETSAQSPRDIPIFAAEQMPQHLADLWARQIVDRHSYALVEPLRNPQTGEIVAPGQIGKVEAPQIDQATATLIPILRNDLVYDQQDGADTVKANTSADAMDIAATRVDAKSGIYLDNWRQTTQCGGEIYLSQASDVYCEAGRTVETMTEDGNDGTATLVEPYTDAKGVAGYRNDFTRGHYKVVVTVTEATATRRDKAVKAALGIAQVAVEAGDTELAQVGILTAVMNHDGEGTKSFQGYARKRLVMMGVEEPTDEEKAQLEQLQAQQDQQQDPQVEFIAAKTQEAKASAIEKTASAGLKTAQAEAVGGPEQAPKAPDGLDAFHKVAQIGKTVAETHKLQTDTEHLPEKLAIERANAGTNRMKVEHQGRSSVFANLAKMLSGRR